MCSTNTVLPRYLRLRETDFWFLSLWPSPHFVELEQYAATTTILLNLGNRAPLEKSLVESRTENGATENESAGLECSRCECFCLNRWNIDSPNRQLLLTSTASSSTGVSSFFPTSTSQATDLSFNSASLLFLFLVDDFLKSAYSGCYTYILATILLYLSYQLQNAAIIL